MGTSSSQRSPSTPEWERVKKLYREPNPDPRQIVSHIVSALDADTRAELSGAGVACCLSNLLRLSRQIALKGLPVDAMTSGLPPLLAVTEMVRNKANEEISQLHLKDGFISDALNALATATFEAGSRGGAGVFDVTSDEVAEALGAFTSEHRLHDLSLSFVGHDLDQVFRNLMERDLDDVVGSENVPGKAWASQLRDAVASHCRYTVSGLEAVGHEQALHGALSESEPRLERIQATLAELTEMSLHKLAVGE